MITLANEKQDTNIDNTKKGPELLKDFEDLEYDRIKQEKVKIAQFY